LPKWHNVRLSSNCVQPLTGGAYDCINEIRLNLPGAKLFEHTSGQARVGAVDILFTLGGLLVAFIVAGWSCARSYYEKGRLRGLEEATREIVRGVNSHYELEGQMVPEPVLKALKFAKAVSERPRKKSKG
jgi:hypothetical protein